MKVFLKEISFFIFLFLISLSIFYLFINNYDFLNVFIYSILSFFIYLLLSKNLKCYRISKITLISFAIFSFAFYSFNIYDFYYKKLSPFIDKIISTKDNQILKEYINGILSQKEKNEILDFFNKEKFKYYKNNDSTYFYFKDVVLGKRYSIKIEISSDDTVKNIYILTGHDAL